ncbi:cytochrome P450 [Chondromyces apiculatus]|uniref:Putative cytochrome P450 hydroxylase n=1 Tax=Chondromyces apiculatus DSM 436 TaxID=1192034 RepID=A0A017SU01_9BACT|nr:cytochrome P450 [Chondromyces apiculatus]EYF00257.1 putative cytochrome P450 hydroxylase [Chondromyces apiculatus DSM 436]
MSTDTDDQVLSYPLPAPSALEPPPEWVQLRERCPVAHVRLASGDSAMMLTRYADIRQVLSDPRFTRDLSADGAARTTANEGGSAFENAEAAALVSGERHQSWRRLVMKWFTAKQILAMQQRMETMVNSLVDDMVAKGAPADLLASVGFPFPVWVICDLLGIPDIDRDKLAYWSNTMLSMTQYTQQEIDAAQLEFRQYMTAHITSKRDNPGPDLISELLTVVDEGQRLTEQELIFTAQGILVAGHETTSNMIGKMMAMLLADRARWEQLLQDPALVRTAVEEALRYDANSGFGLPRFLTHDAEIAGHSVPRGTTLVCSLSAANRDERAFERADAMDLTRTPNPHLAFGAGPHSCVGQTLARTELQTVLTLLLRRLPTLALAVPPDALPRRTGLLVGGLEQVLVRW